MENGDGVNHLFSADDVVSKLKDDGDFDKLRLKIIRKLKENEELRNSIKSVVQQSAALNRPGVENMKRRQLSDAIHQEVGEKVMSQISDGLWEIIRSADGMKSEITETVQSVYTKLLNPKGNENGAASSPCVAMPLQNEADNNGSITTSSGKVDDLMSDAEPNEPPGFSLSHHFRNNNHEDQPIEELKLPVPHGGRPTEEKKDEVHPSQDGLESKDVDLSAPPGFSAAVEAKESCDEDPDVPPGFG